jgi:twinkle protein
MSESTFIRHVPCPECGSTDANGLYTDGHTYCFACSAHTNQPQGTTTGVRRPRVQGLISGEVRGLRARKITDETCKQFNYQVGTYNNRPVQIAPYYDKNGVMVAQKLRFPDKTFSIAGDIKDALPFGAHCWQKQGKKIVVTEGEIDALTMSQVQGNKWPVVSIACGADNPVGADGTPLPMNKIRKYFAKHREYFSGFEEVVLMFDTDEQGRASAKVAAEVLGPRAKIAELPHPYKDANDMLLQDKTEELINAMWKAKEHRPEGIVNMADLKDAVKLRPKAGLSWPFPALTDLTFGIRTGELYALGAGTGVGKTDFFAETIEHLATEHRVPVGVFSLEQNPTETATRLAGKYAKKTFHIPDSGWTEADLDAAWASVMGGGKIFLYDSFGNNDWAIIKEKIEYLAHAEGVKHFFLDHLTALAAWQDDERKALEQIMADMGSLVKKLDIAIFFISHLATPEGKPHEEGGRVMIRHFKGSRAIGFWCHYMFGLERDQQHDNEQIRKTTIFRCLKDRYTGRGTGKTFFLGYDQATGMLFETDAPNAEKTGEAHGFEDESQTNGKPEGDF